MQSDPAPAHAESHTLASAEQACKPGKKPQLWRADEPLDELMPRFAALVACSDIL